MIDFNEIPKVNTGNGDQDTFEFFARDFLENLNFKILFPPGRGADGGKDMIVEERFVSETKSEITFKWLVSCKHYSFSKKSINESIESNIRDRIERHNCQGIICFYSTIPTPELLNNLISIEPKFNYKIFDSAKIKS